MMLRLVVDEPGEARVIEKSDAEVMADALPYLRRLQHCESLHPLSRYAAETLGRTVARLLEEDGAS